MVERVFSALLRGELEREDLSARKLSAWLGHSTIGLYHYFGSLDGFLIRVDGAGWRHLLGVLSRRHRDGASLEDVAIAYVDFARRHPALYWIMSERTFDRARLRKEGRLRQESGLLSAFGDLLGLSEDDTLLVFATLHGLASLDQGGRLDLGGKRAARERVLVTVRALIALVSSSARR